jgi:outer membrane protein assembly factor BamB
MTRQFAAVLILLAAMPAWGEDWPTYMHDSARSGVTPGRVALPLAEHWVYRSPALPKPAWPLPQPGWTELPKVDYDDAFYAVADKDTVYFGSSVDCQVHALDAATGAPRWQFFTGGPVRLAPALARGLVYFGSDDGRIYAVRQADGSLAWAHDPAPSPRRVLGNGRVTSLWPVRTGVLVDGDQLVCGSGIFPYHKVSLLALEAATGQVRWKNDALTGYGGFSPQGYLLAAPGGIVVPSGRATPLVVNRADGQLKFNVPALGGKGETAGTYGLVVDDALFVGTQNILYGVNTQTTQPAGKWLNAAKLLATADSYYLLKGPPSPAYGRKSIAGTANDIICLDRPAYHKLMTRDAAGIKSVQKWRFARPDVESMVIAGDHLVAGGSNEVVVLDRKTGEQVWSGKVEGRAVGLLVSHGRLIVSTTQGAIYCFAPGNAPPAAARPLPPTWPANPPQEQLASLAKEIAAQPGVQKGYGLLIGPAAPRLACELAKQTELTLTCVLFDPREAAAARKLVAAEGLYGWRVSVDLGVPEAIPYPDYAANLVVELRAADQPTCQSAELLRVLRPCGGVLLAGSLDQRGQDKNMSPADVAAWLDEGSLVRDVPLGGSRWTRFIRGTLPGSGWWTHQYADEGNSGSSGDERIKGRLDVLWFGEPGADEFPDRHQRGSAPLMQGGRVYCQGWNFLAKKSTVFCFDAYNGYRYWTREIDDAVRLGLPAVTGNLACDADSVFVAAGPKCYRLDGLTGEIKAVYETPAAADEMPRDWAYLSVADGVVLGSSATPTKDRFSDGVFAYEIETGQRIWHVPAKEILNTTFVVSGGRLLYVENRGQAPASPQAALSPEQKAPYQRTVAALELATGKFAWEKNVELVDCGRWETGIWGAMQALCKDDVLVLAGAYTIYNGGKGQPQPRRALAISTKDGAKLWEAEVANRSRPVAMSGALLAEPQFFDLHTGEKIVKETTKTGRQIMWSSGPRTGGCGSLSASDCMVFGRGGYTVWRDVDSGAGGAFVGTRPGCLINIIPAGGVVVQAEASSGCSCYQAVQCTVVFRPRE